MAFGNCEKLKYIVLGNSVKTIGGAAFGNTDLQSLILNEGLEKIGEDNFSNLIDPPLNHEGMELKVPESVTEMHVMDFHLIVKAGSYAEQYAKENNLTYTVE